MVVLIAEADKVVHVLHLQPMVARLSVLKPTHGYLPELWNLTDTMIFITCV